MNKCVICNERYDGNVIYHLDSLEHRSAEEALWERGEKWSQRKCVIPKCKSLGTVFLHKGPWFRHVQTETHMSARHKFFGKGRSNDPQLNEVMKFKCEVCKFKSFSAQGMKIHINSLQHIQMSISTLADVHEFWMWNAEDQDYTNWFNAEFPGITSENNEEFEKMPSTPPP